MNELFVFIGVPLARGLAGWLQNSLEDGKISVVEWQKLASTLLRIGIPSFALYWGLDVDVEIAATIPLLADYFVSLMSKKFNKN